MSTRVRVGTMVGHGDVETVVKQRLGDFVCIHHLPHEKENAHTCPEYLRKHKIYFVLSELIGRRKYTDKKIDYPYTAEELKKILSAGGKYCLGRGILGESGGHFCWPKDYMIGQGEGVYTNIPPADDVQQAKERYMAFLKKSGEMEDRMGCRPYCQIDGNTFALKYHLEADIGIEIPFFEDLAFNDDMLYAAIRGASRGYGLRRFGTHIPMTWYGGAVVDRLWFQRLKVAFYYAYLAGSSFINTEGGPFGNTCLGNNYTADSPEIRRFCGILREFHGFCKKNPRPEHGPLTKVAFVHGNLDGYSCPGGSTWVWGQFGKKSWKSDAPEWGWDLLRDVYRKNDWFNNTLTGEHDLSGNPPYGQYDVLPIESPRKALNDYACLIFLGWNTMTPEIYGKLKEYVRQGGHLVMALPHLSTHLKREEKLRLYRGGDFSDLFGVKVRGAEEESATGIKFTSESETYRFPDWTLDSDPKCLNNGFPIAKVRLKGAKTLAFSARFFTHAREKTAPPVLVENRLGKGTAILALSLCYPGTPEMQPFMREVLKAVMLGEHTEPLRVVAADKTRYAVYEENDKKTLYLLNTDFDLASECRVTWKNAERSYTLGPTEMKIVRLGR